MKQKQFKKYRARLLKERDSLYRPKNRLLNELSFRVWTDGRKALVLHDHKHDRTLVLGYIDDVLTLFEEVERQPRRIHAEGPAALYEWEERTGLHFTEKLDLDFLLL